MSAVSPLGLTRVLMSGKASAGASADYSPQSINHSVQVVGTFIGVVVVEASNDRVNWSPIGVAITVGGIQNITGAYKYLRLNVTSFTSGSITATMYE